jgi:hypothetical protein
MAQSLWHVPKVRMKILERESNKGMKFKWKERSRELVVPVTFGHPWVRHSSHPERSAAPDVMRAVLRVHNRGVLKKVKESYPLFYVSKVRELRTLKKPKPRSHLFKLCT